MIKNVFEIKGLKCSYPQKGKKEGKLVLSVPDLSVPMGQVTVILGMSGSGKSTLIETLGLMNRTMEEGVVTYHHQDGKIVINRAIWDHPSQLAGIRQRHFSFIFQHDFLMPYYTPGENMMIGRLIQGHVADVSCTEKDIGTRCRQIGLDPRSFSEKMPADLSVGQRQRLSFIRAAMKDYDVLFGDEPTGNLDEANAEILLDLLVESIRPEMNRSAILVSHNIPLSVKKAGCLIVLSHVKGDLYEARTDNVFTRQADGWMNGSGEVYGNAVLETKIRAIVREEITGEDPDKPAGS